MVCKYCPPTLGSLSIFRFFLCLPKLNLDDHKPLSPCLSFSSSFIHPSLLVSTILDTSYKCNHIYLSCREGAFHLVIILKVVVPISECLCHFAFDLCCYEKIHSDQKKLRGGKKGFISACGLQTITERT